jgi:antitoxin PrlF
LPRALLKSRLGAKSQTVLPKAVRQALNLQPGDEVGYVVEHGRVELVKLRRGEENPFACFTEWQSEADTKGYASL